MFSVNHIHHFLGETKELELPEDLERLELPEDDGDLLL